MPLLSQRSIEERQVQQLLLRNLILVLLQLCDIP